MSGIKQVVVVRRDLGMGKGKIAAQVAHASCNNIFLILEGSNPTWKEWLRSWRLSGQEKVVLKVDSERELLSVYQHALALNLPASLVADAGRTQIKPGTKTAVAIGPAPENIIDKITGSLKLL